MKKLIAIALAALATSASAAVVDTVHNMTTKGGTRSVCVYCHAPHKGKGGTGAPLWNRIGTTTTFTQTNASGVTHTIAPTDTSASLLCLSCHDATVNLGSTLTNAETLTAIANYAIVGGTRAADVNGNGANTLGSLSSDHPVAVTYPATGTTTGAVLFPVGTAAGLLGLTTAQLATVECGSCHDPHTTANSKFLRIAAASICTACHNK